jgi:hypothetical protein
MTTFNHVTDIGHRDNISSLEDNLKSFFDWSFLNIGAFINVNISTNSLDGGDFSKLKPVSGDPTIVYPRVWETARKDWVYETGVSHNGISPYAISGINLNGTFLPAPTGSGAYSYNINYPLGRITFNNNISDKSNINLKYSYRLVQVYKSSNSPWWKEVVENSYNPSVIQNKESSYNQIQLPAIVIDIAPRSISIPYELGTSTNILVQDVMIHILTENPVQRNNIVDILLKQKDKTLNLYDIQKLVKRNKQFINYRGEPNPNRLNYDQIYNDQSFYLSKAYIKNSTLSELNSFSNNLYHGVLRLSIEIYPTL